LCQVERLAGFLYPATINQQYGFIGEANQRRDDVITVATVDDDVLEQHLVRGIVTSGCLESLIRANFHAVVPGRKPGFIAKQLLVGPLFHAAANLPGPESRKLRD